MNAALQAYVAVIEGSLLQAKTLESMLLDALARTGGNMQKAAAFLEISQSTLYRKKAEMELQDGDDRELA